MSFLERLCLTPLIFWFVVVVTSRLIGKLLVPHLFIQLDYWLQLLTAVLCGLDQLPHQATLGLAPYDVWQVDLSLRLAADLDYFLRLSSHSDVFVQCLDLELVHMGDGGVSGQQTSVVLEVPAIWCFSRWWLFPFVSRYIRRLLSVLGN